LPEGLFELIRGEFAESRVLEKEIYPKQIRYFQRKLKIPIHHFWHPEEAEKGAQLKIEAEAKVKIKKETESNEAPE
jgi:hypothetical protein